MIFDQMADRVQAAVYCAAVVFGPAEILAKRSLLIFCHMDRMSYQLIDAFIFGSGDRDYRHTEHRFHAVDIDGASVSVHLVHHVKRDDHRYIHLQKLHGQIQVSFDVGRVDDVDDALRLFIDDKISGNHFFGRIRRHRINTGKVCDQRVLLSADRPVLSVYRDTREVTYMLSGACQLVKQGRLSGVLISHQGKCQERSRRQRISRSLWMIFPFLTESGMLSLLLFGMLFPFCGSRLSVFHLNFCGIIDTQSQLVAMDLELHRIAQRRIFYYRDLCAGNDSHIQEMLAQRAFSAYSGNDTAFARL